MSNIRISINYKAMTRMLGIILLISGLLMIVPWLYAELTNDVECVSGFRLSSPLSIVIGAFLAILLKSDRAKFRIREGYIIVASCWVFAILAGSLPYYFSSFTDSFIDSLFESTAGLTTTGCSAVNGAYLPKSLLLWKAITHWLGGMGILVFAISILPALGINGQFIVRAETPGPVLQKMTVRISDSAKILYIMYIAFTIAEFLLLLASGQMTVFDAFVNTMGSISTGGLTVHSAGIAYYDSVYVEIVISVFCLFSSVNFLLYHYLITGKGKYMLKDIELRAFAIIILCAITMCTFALIVINGDTFGTALRDSFFQVISMATTTGYVRSPYIVWPTVCQIVLVVLLLIGGCSSSTAGSIKVIRVLVMLKLIFRGCTKRIHPRSVVAVKLGKNSVSAPVVSGITVFILVYLSLILLSMFVLSLEGFSMETTFTSSLAMLSNTGAAFGDAASLGNFSMFSGPSKLYLCALMITGRLELFTIIVFFSKSFWDKNR